MCPRRALDHRAVEGRDRLPLYTLQHGRAQQAAARAGRRRSDGTRGVHHGDRRVVQRYGQFGDT